MSDPTQPPKISEIDQQSTTAEINNVTAVPTPLTDIIAVHGLNGDHKGTWSHPSGNLWLKDLKLQIPQSRILTFEYESDISKVGWELVSPVGIWRIAVQLLHAILEERGDSGELVPRSIIFIAQGFGGIIVKQALWIANYQHAYLPIAVQTLGVVFFGTPHSAVDQDSWERIIFNMAAVSRENLIKPGILACLGRRVSPLDVSGWSEVSEKFYSIVEKYKVINIFEKKEIPWLGSLVLDEESAAWSPKDGQWSRDESHLMLCTFDTDGHEDFIRLSNELKVIAGMQKDFDQGWFECLQKLTTVSRGSCSLNTWNHPETLGWIWDDEEYKHWWGENGQRILHLRGSAGKGKTTLCTFLSSTLRKDKEVTVLSFFCNGRGDHRDPAKHILLSMVRQLLLYQPPVHQYIKELYTSLLENPIWAKEDVWGLFRAMLSHSHGTSLVCLIDALDECGNDSSSSWLLEHLAGLQQETDFPFTLVVSSQCPAEDLTPSVSLERFVVINLDNREKLHLDVGKIAQSWVSDLVRVTPAFNGLKDYLLNNLRPFLAQPTTTFLTLKIGLRLLAQPHIGWIPASLLENISFLDSNLHHLYERVLDQVPEKHQQWARKALSWVSYSYRPLTLNEIYTVMSVQGKEDKERVGPLNIIHDLISVLGPLVRFERDEIHLIHHSFKEFLLEDETQDKERWYSFDNSTAHAEIFDTCLAYLSGEGILSVYEGDKPFERDIELHTLMPFDSEELGLLLYASQYWPKHYQQSASVMRVPSGYNQVLEFFHQMGASTWYRINRLLEGGSSEQDIFSPLIVAAKLGLPSVISELQGETDNSNNQTALELAAANGHKEVVEELLGTEELSIELDLSTALIKASEMGHKHVVEKLILVAEQRIPRDSLGLEAALSVSARNGHTDIVELLLQNDTPVNSTYEDLTPLQHAAKNGREHVVKVLLESPDINITYETKDSPMHLAAKSGYLTIVELLLSAGSSPGADDNEVGPLHLAATYGHLKVVNRILKADPELITSKDDTGMNALHWAAWKGHITIVKKLIEAKVEVDDTDDNLHLPLHFAAAGGYVDVVEALIAEHATKDIDIDITDENQCNALYYAAAGGHANVVRRLLKGGADPVELCGGDFPMTPLHLAATAGHIDVINALMEGGASIDQKSNGGLAPIHLATMNASALKRLIELGANINAYNDDKSSPLMLAAQLGNEEGVKMLLEAGAVVQAKDNNGSTALHEAIQPGSWPIVEALLSSGASPMNRRDSDNATPLDIAINIDESDLVVKMVDWITEKDYWQDPFQIIISNGSENLIELWLKHRPQDKISVSGLGTPSLLRFAARGIAQHVVSLINSGVDNDEFDIHGRVALDVALHPEVRKILKGENVTEGNEEDLAEDTSDDSTKKECRLVIGRPRYNNSLGNRACDICGCEIEMFFYHCCECNDDDYDICSNCYDESNRCPDPENHKLKIRFVFDGMLSFEELSPWVAKRVVPMPEIDSDDDQDF